MNAKILKTGQAPEGSGPAEPSPARRRVFIVDDHAMFRDGLRRLIDLEPDLSVCGDAPDAAKTAPTRR